MIFSPGAAEAVLAFADDEHMMGQRHTEWIGMAPFLEEDLAMSSIAQDELGHAAGLYELLVGGAGTGRGAGAGAGGTAAAVDRLAFRRAPGDYRCCWLVEQPCREWAAALARHWLYDLAERHRWEAVAGSSSAPLAALAARALREEQYHRRHADAMIERLVADAQARPAMAAALDECLPLAAALFEPVAGEPEALTGGVVTESSAALRALWWDEASRALDQMGLSRAMPEIDPRLQRARTVRSEHFARLHARINEVLSVAPDASW